MKKYFPLVFLLAFAIGCSNEKESKDNDSKKDTLKTSEFEFSPQKKDNQIFLEGVYGTSTRLPFFEYQAGNCFDGNLETPWITMNGSGPNEGVMAYFSNPLNISEIVVVPLVREDVADILSVSVYCNGKSIGVFKPDEKIAINQNVSSLYFKVNEVSHTIRKTLSSQEDEGEEKWIEFFDESYSVGISEIQLFDDNGPVNVSAPLMVKGSVNSSSVLLPKSAYHAANLFDAKKDVVWAEGTNGTGEGEELYFSFFESVKIDGIIIFNGYQRSENHYNSNARLKSFEFEIKGNPESKQSYSIEDTDMGQKVIFEKSLTGKEFVLRVKDVFPGEKYEDLVISEMLLVCNDVPFVICSNFQEENILENHKITEGTPLEKLLDKNIRNYYYGSFNSTFASDKSILIRSDNTFVMYNNEYDDDRSFKDTLRIVADGNWEIIESNNTMAKIRVFGKYANLTEDYGMYKGKGIKTFRKIFQDYVTITSDNLHGEQFIEEFVLPE